jgi:hypothetical protein
LGDNWAKTALLQLWSESIIFPRKSKRSTSTTSLATPAALATTSASPASLEST